MQKFFAYLQNKCQLCASSSHGQASIKLPFFGIIFGPFSLLIDNTKNILLIGAIYALVLTILSLSFGSGYMCSYPAYQEQGNYCLNDGSLKIFYLFLRFVVLCAFMATFYRICFVQAPFNIKAFLDVKNILRSLGGVTFFLLLNSIALVAIYMLYQRVPNPNWKIELAYFAIVSIWILMPFILMRFYAILAFVWAGEALPGILSVAKRNRGNMLRIMLGFFLLFFVTVFVFLAYYNNFRLVANTNAVYISAMVEFLYNLLVLILVSLFVNNCYLQKVYLFGRNKNE